jgi:hypothetical protein
MSYYIGTQPSETGDSNTRFFYAIRRTDDGLLYFVKIDQLKDADDSITINNPGLTENDYTEFEYGVDFFDGRLEEDHSRPFSNLEWDQYRWDNRSVFYYINEQGEFVVRINKEYTYDPTQIVT